MIRSTWAHKGNVVSFVVAGNWTEALRAEFESHGDLIWVNVTEKYLKLTVKVYGAFHAVHSHIPLSAALGNATQYRRVLKTDDDVCV
mgnify:CR=1 FL=1